MKTGRNDPCPCGSGRKYKHCCLGKEQEQVPSQPATDPPVSASELDMEPVSAIEPKLDPLMQAMDARWDAFKAADFEGKIAVYTQTLQEPELMDSDMAFEMLSLLYEGCVERQQRHRFDAWISALRSAVPEAYTDNVAYLIDWQLSNALVTAEYATLPALVPEMAACAATDPDLYQVMLDKLAYHGQTALLLDTVSAGWPSVKSSNVLAWAVDEYAHQAMDFTVLDAIEHYPNEPITEATLKQRLSIYGDPDNLDWERLKGYIALASGCDKPLWNADDFTPNAKQRAERLYFLSAAFLGYLQHENTVPLARAELARRALLGYLLNRYGELKPSSKQRKVNGAVALCPGRASLDRFLGEVLGFLSPQYYQAISLFEFIPAWLQFLHSVHLIDSAMVDTTLRQLRPLHESLLSMCQQRFDDPVLVQALQNWPTMTAR